MQRVGEVVQADMVLSRHDGWRRPSGRLDVKLADDHMNTKAWKAADATGANVSTQGVHLSSCWALGRTKALETLRPLYDLLVCVLCVHCVDVIILAVIDIGTIPCSSTCSSRIWLRTNEHC